VLEVISSAQSDHPYEKHHWLEKIPLDPVNRVDFGIGIDNGA